MYLSIPFSKTHKMRLFVLFFLSLFSFSLTAQNNKNSNAVLKNITYKIANTTDSIKLDIYQPTKKVYSKSPVMVLIHGGAWAKGDKEIKDNYYFRSLKDTLQTKGYAVISINYRLVNQRIHIADQLQDCKDALKWIAQQATVYNFDVDNIGIWGESAGAHLALLTLHKPQNTAEKHPELRYVIDNFGPIDLNKVLKTDASWFTKKTYKLLLPELYDIREKLIRAITSYDINTNKEEAMAVAMQYSPETYLENPNKTPTLILHGTRDFIVAFKQSKKLHKKLTQKTVENKLIKVKKGNHGFRNIPEAEIQKLIQETYSFIQQHYKTSDS